MSAQKKAKRPQKAVITLTDSPDGRSMVIKIDFIPMAENKPVTSPSVQMAMHAMVAITEEITRRNKEAHS